MIYLSPYDTTIGKAFNINGLEQAIKTALVQKHHWIKIDEAVGTIAIYPNQIINKFDHPILVELRPGLKLSAVDLTAFVREGAPGEYTVANKPLYSLQTIRSALTADMAQNGTRNIKSLSPNIMKSYSDLITNAMSIAFHLNPEDIIAIRVKAAWLYHSMLSEQEVIGDLELQALTARISREINIPSNYIARYVDGVVYKSVEDFIQDIRESLDNPSLRGFNTGVFYATVAKNLNSAVWVGLDKQQLLAIAMEHIPTFVACLVICLTEQAFKNAGLTKIALRNFTRDKTQFVLGVTAIVESR